MLSLLESSSHVSICEVCSIQFIVCKSCVLAHQSILLKGGYQFSRVTGSYYKVIVQVFSLVDVVFSAGRYLILTAKWSPAWTDNIIYERVTQFFFFFLNRHA